MLILYYVFSVLAIISALFVIAARNPIHSAIALVVTLFNVAGIYVLLDATFLAAIQVLVYAGAIMVLFVFVIMLLNLNTLELHELEASGPFKFLIGITTLSSLALIGVFLGVPKYFSSLHEGNFGSIEFVGKTLFTDYIVPFEVTSILLTISILGAVLLAKRSLKI